MILDATLRRNPMVLPNMNLASLSLATLQEKIARLMCQPDVKAEFDFNEATIVVAALHMYEVHIIFSPPPTEEKEHILKTCHEMSAHFAELQKHARRK